jgi:hypothetical protein
MVIDRPGSEIAIGVSPATAPHGEAGAFFDLTSIPGQVFHLRLERSGSHLTATISGAVRPDLTLGPALDGETRLALRLGRGASVSILRLLMEDRP